MEWHLIFPSDSQLCIWWSPVKAFTKQSPLENSISDNQVVEKKAKIKKAGILSKCLQGKSSWKISGDREFLDWTMTEGMQQWEDSSVDFNPFVPLCVYLHFFRLLIPVSPPLSIKGQTLYFAHGRAAGPGVSHIMAVSCPRIFSPLLLTQVVTCPLPKVRSCDLRVQLTWLQIGLHQSWTITVARSFTLGGPCFPLL